MQVKVEQGSKEWLAMRRGKITSTDAVVIMGKVPSNYQINTKYKLFMHKIGLGETINISPAMKLGTELEPYARQKFIDVTGIEVKPAVFLGTDFPFTMASLDAVDEGKRVIVEIKCPGNSNHQHALDGQISEGYIIQMHHQMICTGIRQCYYMSYTPESHVIIEVMFDHKLASEIIEQEKEFYECHLQTLEAPELTDRDYVKITNPESLDKAGQLKAIQAQIKELEQQEDGLRRWLIENHGEHPSKIGEVTLTKVAQKGRIQYKNIPALQGTNLEDFRGNPISYYRIS